MKRLTRRDFTFAPNINRAGEWWPVYSWTCPTNHQALLLANSALNLYLVTAETIEHQGAGEEALQLVGLPVDTAEGITDGEDLMAFDSVTGDRLPITDADFVAGTVTVDLVAAAPTDVTIYYRPAAGQLRLELVVPTAGSQIITLAQWDLRNLHQRDQYGLASRVVLPAAAPIAEEWQLRIAVRTPAIISDAAEASNAVVSVPVEIAPLHPQFKTEALRMLGIQK